MKTIFYDANALDKRCYDEFFMSEDMLMENAAFNLANLIKKQLPKKSTILYICGPGNNGADGIACARMLYGDYKIKIFLPFGAKSPMAKKQLKIANALKIKFVNKIIQTSCYIDCLFGSGFKDNLDEDSQNIINDVNKINALKISCDVPSGLDLNGNVKSIAFESDFTVAMGVAKLGLFSDIAKDYVGKIYITNLGLSQEIYSQKSNFHLLEKSDIKLPFRKMQNTNKGNFGHLCVLMGDKQGACVLAASAASVFGAGLVTVVGECLSLPFNLMQTKIIPKKTNTIVAGMGLGKFYDEKKLLDILKNNANSLVIDADIFYMKIINEILTLKKEIILTPHPKEFASLLKNTDFGEYSTEDIQNNRFELAQKFANKFNVILVLKGANTIIAWKNELFISTFSNQALAKGGSGDVLAGMIGSLLAQGYCGLDAAKTALLAQGLVAKKFKKNNYSLLPEDIIEGLKWI